MSIVRIAKISGVATSYQNIGNIKKHNSNENINQPQTNPIENTYKDFNINFRGRTPENFYEQEYNVNHMPQEMKKYLNTDYETRKHIPPEQIMNEVFKYIPMAEKVEDVKELYPDEELFSNLHSASLKNRTGILSDIKLAKELDNAPLLKEQNLDFGVYLLKKIYVEGKTIREINKDFYEKDMNPAYKGIVTQPINYSTTSAYGIRYPKQDFWNSFIATREEYKKFFVENMPKLEKKIGSKNTSSAHNTSHTTNTTNEVKAKEPAKRKYKIQNYKKRALKDDIKNAKGDKAAIEKAVIRRFTKDDPEASFIVKYLSPIMIVSADRVHLSEEMKDFAHSDKVQNQTDLFKRFWKANPFLLEQYSTAITDTIELFEEVYGAGGNLGINNEFKIVDKNTENKKIIDFVPEEFKQLLDFAQGIIPARNAKYEAHDKLQEQWNKHFIERYGEVKEEITPKDIAPKNETPQNVAPKEILQDKNDKRIIISLEGVDGQPVKARVDLEEGVKDYLTSNTPAAAPNRYKNLYLRECLNNSLCNDMFKVSVSLRSIRDRLKEGQILSDEEIQKTLYLINNDFYKKHSNEVEASDFAVSETYADNEGAYKIYRFLFGNATKADKEYYANKVFDENKNANELQKNIDTLYDKYSKPVTAPEAQKISILLTDYISKLSNKDATSIHSVLAGEPLITDFIEIARRYMNEGKDNRKMFKNILSKMVNLHNGTKAVLNNDKGENIKKSRIEAALLVSVRALFDRDNNFAQSLSDEEKLTLMDLLDKLKYARKFKQI